MRPRIVVNLIYVEWGGTSRRSSLDEAVRSVALAGAELNQLVVVDNKGECAPVQVAGARKVTLLQGNNVAREFSGWDMGYEAVRTDTRANVLLFVNDTLGAHRRRRLSRRIRVAGWLKTLGRSPSAQMFGQLDRFGTAPAPWLFGNLDWYVSTYLFGMTPKAARVLFPLCQIDEALDPMLHNAFSSAGLFTELLPSEYRDRINAWLLTPGQWRNAAPLTAANFAFFRLKAKSVLYEFALTSRAVGAGIPVSDLFDGRNGLDRLFGRLTKHWIERTTVSRYPWLTAARGRVRRMKDASNSGSARPEQGSDTIALLGGELRRGPG